MSDYNINCLQQIEDGATHRIVSNIRKYDRKTPIHQNLHWLPVGELIHFKILLNYS